MMTKAFMQMVILLIVSFDSLCQSIEIEGIWKVKTVDNGEFFMDIKTDSIALYEAFDYIQGDSLKINIVKETAKLSYFDQKFIFHDGMFSLKSVHGFFNIESAYKVENDSLIMVYELKSRDTVHQFLMKYYLDEIGLFLEIPLTDPPVKIQLIK